MLKFPDGIKFTAGIKTRLVDRIGFC